MRIAITGANSSVGHAFLNSLVNQTGNEITVNAGVRRQAAADTLPDHPSITPYVIQYGDSASLEQLLDGATCVVHLAGILIESPSSNYQTANIDATSAVVKAAQRAKLGQIVLVSALGANSLSTNGYYRSKGLAEDAVTASGIPADIIRTPMLLGSGTAGAKGASRHGLTAVRQSAWRRRTGPTPVGRGRPNAGYSTMRPARTAWYKHLRTCRPGTRHAP